MSQPARPRTVLRPLEATTLPELPSLDDEALEHVHGALTAYINDSQPTPTWTWTWPTDPDGLITKDDN